MKAPESAKPNELFGKGKAPASVEWICKCGEQLFEVVPVTPIREFLGTGEFHFKVTKDGRAMANVYRCIGCGTFWNPSKPENRKAILEVANG